MFIVRPSSSLKLLFAVVLLATCLLCFTSPARADGDRYGAIAYSQSTGTYGYSYGWGNRATAENVALANCRGENAQVVVWARNAYCALALGDTVGSYGWGYGATAAEARTHALRNARKSTTNCYIAVTVFSGN
jgi:Domain of unknown function (DUF4189)